ncbi:MAG: metal ABC transporter substrate-binding protein [Syntrophomonadaceae bacterium]
MPQKILKIILVAALLTNLIGCRTQVPTGSQNDKKVKIVTSFYPVYIMTLNLTQGISGIEVENMTPAASGCLHDYQLTPQNLITLKQADVVIVNGGGMESFMDKVAQEVPHGRIITASQGLNLLKDADGEENPHVWVSVSGAIDETRNINRQLAQLLPQYTQQCQANCDAYVEKLEQLNSEMKTGLAGISKRNIVTFHEAFPYFARDFGLNIVAVVQSEPNTEPSARELAVIIDKVKQTGTTALFIEPQYQGVSVETVARETGARVYTLDPAVTGSNHPDAYISTMKNNLQTLKEALR